MGEIECRRCGRTKPSDGYSLDRGRIRQPCKECRAETERQRRAANAQREVVDTPLLKWCAGCEHVHPSDDFARDSNSADGLQSACRVCQRKRTKRRTAALKEVRHRIIERIVVDQQDWRCPGCGRSPDLNRERIGRTRIEWDSRWRTFDSFYGGLVAGYISKAEFMQHPAMHPRQIVGIVHPTQTATSLAEWYQGQADKEAARVEVRARCEEMVGICIRCHERFLKAAGIMEKHKKK